jgi:general secretion pathway protein B
MSFILDALRKSETERQRKSTPGLIEPGFRPPARRRAIWLPLVVLALAANLVLLGALWLRRDPAPAAMAEHAEPAPGGGAADIAPPAPVDGGLAAAAGLSSPEDSEFQATADIPAMEAEAGTGSFSPPGEPSAGHEAGGQPGSGRFVTDDLPSAEQLIASGAIPAQPLHLDIHVYSAAPAERFVFINMRKYAEGAELPEGAKIEEITRDGVVLSQAGQRFVLSRD